MLPINILRSINAEGKKKKHQNHCVFDHLSFSSLPPASLLDSPRLRDGLETFQDPFENLFLGLFSSFPSSSNIITIIVIVIARITMSIGNTLRDTVAERETEQTREQHHTHTPDIAAVRVLSPDDFWCEVPGAAAPEHCLLEP